MNNILRPLALTALLIVATLSTSHAWWDKAWTARQSVTLDTGASGFTMTDPAGTSVVLLRLHQGNFDFAAVRPDGSDLRIVAADDKTVLPHQVEKFDSLVNEAFVWVQVPDIQPGTQTKVWLYSANASEAIEPGGDPKATYDDDTILVYHFTGSAIPTDATKNANNAASGGTLSEGSLIASGMRLLGNTAIKIPASETLKREAGAPFTFSAWLKPTSVEGEAIFLSWEDGANRLRLGLSAGVPFVEIRDASGTKRTAAGEPLAASIWKHIVVVGTNASTTLYINGEEYGKVDVPIPALATEASLGSDPEGKVGVVGELDEVQISKIARGAGWVEFAYISQAGNDATTKLVALGEPEGGSGPGGGGAAKALEHVFLFGDIANNMMFDGWIAVVICVFMLIAAGIVAVQKYIDLGKIEKGNKEFQTLWRGVASDLTSMDLDDPKADKSFGGKVSKKGLRLLADSPLYYIYHVGSEEICHRLGRGKNKGQGLSSRSIQAIRAALDAALVHEQHRLSKNLVYLTVSIAGGPYVGLLGTVVGVMITFAIIAKSGQVEVNSIAPGIASALLATTVGLLVAIPALFAYSFLNTRIKSVLGEMQVFIDEFVSKIAEFYPPPGEAALPVPIRQVRSPEEAARQAEAERGENLSERRSS